MNLEHFHALNKLTGTNNEPSLTVQDWHNDRDNNDTRSNGRGANVRIKEKKEIGHKGKLALDTQERDLLEKLHTLATQEGDLLERLVIVRRKQTKNDGARKRKHSSDSEDTKPSASKP